MRMYCIPSRKHLLVCGQHNQFSLLRVKMHSYFQAIQNYVCSYCSSLPTSKFYKSGVINFRNRYFRRRKQHQVFRYAVLDAKVCVWPGGGGTSKTTNFFPEAIAAKF